MHNAPLHKQCGAAADEGGGKGGSGDGGIASAGGWGGNGYAGGYEVGFLDGEASPSGEICVGVQSGIVGSYGNNFFSSGRNGQGSHSSREIKTGSTIQHISAWQPEEILSGAHMFST